MGFCKTTILEFSKRLNLPIINLGREIELLNCVGDNLAGFTANSGQKSLLILN